VSTAKRRVRQLERAARSTSANSTAAAEWTAERRAYCALLRRKRGAFWTSKVDAERASPRQLWRSIDALMGRGRVPPSEDIGAAEFQRHFDAKLADVRALTANAPPPSFSSAPSGCTFADFQPLTINDVTAAIRLLPDKHCASDPIPTSLLKDCADVLAPFLVQLYNKSLGQASSVPAMFKAAYATVEEV